MPKTPVTAPKISFDGFDIDDFNMDYLKMAARMSTEFQDDEIEESIFTDFNITTVGYVAALINQEFDLKDDEKFDEQKMLALLTAGFLKEQKPMKGLLDAMKDHSEVTSPEFSNEIEKKAFDKRFLAGVVGTSFLNAFGIISLKAMIVVVPIAIIGTLASYFISKDLAKEKTNKIVKDKLETVENRLSDVVNSIFDKNDDNALDIYDEDFMQEQVETNKPNFIQGTRLENRLPIRFRFEA